MMNFYALEIVLVVRNTGSFHKAGDKILTSAQNVSKIINKLEEEFKIKIFQRTAGGLKPTPEGYKVMAFAEEVLLKKKLLEMDFSSAECTTDHKVIDLFVGPAIYALNIGEFIIAFSNKFPQIQVNLQERDLLAIYKIVADNPSAVGIAPVLDNPQFDFLFDAYRNQLQTYPLCSDCIICLAGKNSSLAQQKSVSLGEMVTCPIAILSKFDLADNHYVGILGVVGVPQIAFVTSHAGMFRDTIANGKCYGFLPYSIFQRNPSFHQKGLVAIPIEEDLRLHYALLVNTTNDGNVMQQIFIEQLLRFFE